MADDSLHHAGGPDEPPVVDVRVDDLPRRAAGSAPDRYAAVDGSTDWETPVAGGQTRDSSFLHPELSGYTIPAHRDSVEEYPQTLSGKQFVLREQWEKGSFSDNRS